MQCGGAGAFGLTPSRPETIDRPMGLLDRIQITPKGAEPPEAIDVNDRHEIQIAWPGRTSRFTQ